MGVFLHGMNVASGSVLDIELRSPILFKPTVILIELVAVFLQFL